MKLKTVLPDLARFIKRSKWREIIAVADVVVLYESRVPALTYTLIKRGTKMMKRFSKIRNPPVAFAICILAFALLSTVSMGANELPLDGQIAYYLPLAIEHLSRAKDCGEQNDPSNFEWHMARAYEALSTAQDIDTKNQLPGLSQGFDPTQRSEISWKIPYVWSLYFLIGGHLEKSKEQARLAVEMSAPINSNDLNRKEAEDLVRNLDSIGVPDVGPLAGGPGLDGLLE